MPLLTARIDGIGGWLSTFQATKNLSFSYPQAIHKHLWKSCGWISMLASCNEQKSSIGAGFRRVLLATMKAQQAVAIRFVGRRVTRSTCLFFSFSTALRAFTSQRDVSLRCNGCAVVST
ncbi:MAG: hypothetical protein AB7F38_06525, partial [Piscinibacter sp.]